VRLFNSVGSGLRSPFLVALFAMIGCEKGKLFIKLNLNFKRAMREGDGSLAKINYGIKILLYYIKYYTIMSRL
jgi:hypothetical protein